MISVRVFRNVLMGGFISAWVLCAGCGAIPEPKLSPEAAFVVNNKMAFAVVDGGPLAEASEGEVIDLLQGLDGCWGSFVSNDAEGNSFLAQMIESLAGNRRLDSFHVQVFDQDQGTIVGWSVLDFFGLSKEIGGGQGTFSVTGDNQIIIQYEALYVATKEQFVPTGPQPRTFEWLVTLDGDVMRWRFVSTRSTSLVPFTLDDITFFRFDCPGASVTE